MRRHRLWVLATVVAALGGTSALGFVGAPSVLADAQSYSGSVELSSLPSSAPVVIDQFDPSVGTLSSLTVTADLDGSVQSMVENLSSVSSNSTLSFLASAHADGPGSVDLDLTGVDGL